MQTYQQMTTAKFLSLEFRLKERAKNGAVFIYQSIEVMHETLRSTTKFILLAAGVAIILTTIFAFFLSTRINAPLRKMKEGAFEVARGKFDTKVPILTNDEVGELAMAFNQMGRRLKFNMNALSQEKEATGKHFKRNGRWGNHLQPGWNNPDHQSSGRAVFAKLVL